MKQAEEKRAGLHRDAGDKHRGIQGIRASATGSTSKVVLAMITGKRQRVNHAAVVPDLKMQVGSGGSPG